MTYIPRWCSVTLLLLSLFFVGCGSRPTGALTPEPSALEAFEAEQARAREEAASAFASEKQE